MKFVLLPLITLASISFANAADYPLKPSQDSYVSLNECLYAHGKGVKLGGSSTDTYVYKNELWQITYDAAEKQISCEVLGVLSE